MRHKDPRLTLQIYTDAGQLDLDEAVSRLPDLSSSRAEASLSDGAKGRTANAMSRRARPSRVGGR
jgi:hypothetical protein